MSAMHPQRALYSKILQSLNETSFNEDTAHEIAFHMLDWYEQLKPFIALCENPNSFSSEQVEEVLRDLLSHAPAHMAAAGLHMMGIPVRDVFGVGAVECD
jgi:elongation factor P--beta-lysine ligase